MVPQNTFCASVTNSVSHAETTPYVEVADASFVTQRSQAASTFASVIAVVEAARPSVRSNNSMRIVGTSRAATA